MKKTHQRFLYKKSLVYLHFNNGLKLINTDAQASLASIQIMHSFFRKKDLTCSDCISFFVLTFYKMCPFAGSKTDFTSYFLHCTLKSDKLVSFKKKYFNSVLTLNIGIASFSLYKPVSC